MKSYPAYSLHGNINEVVFSKYLSIYNSVFNVSRRSLSTEEISLLSKGLRFSPMPNDINRAQLKIALDAFKRRMRLRWFFRNREKEDNNLDDFKFRCKSSRNPPNNDPLLETFLSQLEKEVLSESLEGKTHSNLSPSELSALNNLKSDKNIIIKEAGKGSAVVVWHWGDYMEEANRQLNDG